MGWVTFFSLPSSDSSATMSCQKMIIALFIKCNDHAKES
jgi:hypothetical protein